jgi:hypothetical protein
MLPKTPRGTLLALLALIASCAMAQPGKPKTKVVLYKDRIAAQWDTVDCVKSALKINPLLFLRGEVPVYYERALSSRLSAEFGVGLTFRNYVNLTFAGDHADAVAVACHADDMFGGDIGGQQRHADKRPSQISAGEEIFAVGLLLACCAQHGPNHQDETGEDDDGVKEA